MKDAAGHQLERTDQEIIFRVVDSYYGVLLARKQLEVAEQSMKTAQAILDRSKDRFESGVVVESDLPERPGAAGDAKAGTHPRPK